LLAARDPFGRLTREHVLRGLVRGLTSGTVDSSGGGAGLGFLVMYKAATMIAFDVIPGVCTQASVVLDLDVPQRELRTLPRSVHLYRDR
jgi:hypothetical protein